MGVADRLRALDNRVLGPPREHARDPDSGEISPGLLDYLSPQFRDQLPPRLVRWLSTPRSAGTDLGREAIVPVIGGPAATIYGLLFIADAIEDVTNPAGIDSRLLAALAGLGLLLAGLAAIAYCVIWACRPARPSEAWPFQSKKE